MFTVGSPDHRVGRWRLLVADGADVPQHWRVEVLRADRTPVALHRRGPTLCFTDPLVVGEHLLVEVHRPAPGTGYVRHVRRIVVQEAPVPDTDPTPGTAPNRSASAGDGGAHAIAALDFGTFAKSGALWENRKHLSRGSVSLAQVAALRAALGETWESPADIERWSFATYDEDTDEIVDRRHEAWDVVFQTAPLEHYGIRQLIESAPLRLHDGGPAAAGDASAGALPAPGVGSLGSRGIKRDLLKKSTGEDVTAGLVEAYRGIAREGLDGIRDEYGKPRLPLGIQFTYPTRLPAAQRRRLEEQLRATGLPNPKLGMDEATAVAFFDLLTRIGQRAELGVAALEAQAASRRGDDALTERVLVIDVGAGTTDIALVDMRIEDVTSGRVPPGRGRYRMLAPQVLASGGALTFGADGLTLDFFRGIKRRLREDGLSTPPPATNWRGIDHDPAERERRWAAFLVLWDAAETAKVQALGAFAGSDVPVSVTLDGSPRQVELRWDDVVTATDGFLRRLAALAAGIAKAGLSVLASDESTPPQVHRIVLSGQSFTSEYLRTKLRDLLNVVFRDDERLDDTFEVVHHAQYLKSAAALGAAFAASISTSQFEPENDVVVARLAAGENKFGYRMADLRSNLAAEFRWAVGGMGRETMTLFERGTALTMTRASSETGPKSEPIVRRYIRSDPQAASASVSIVRNDVVDVRQPLLEDHKESSDTSITWGHFVIPDWETIRGLPQPPGEAMRRTFVTYEIDDEEEIVMYLHLDALPLDVAGGTTHTTVPLDEDGALRDALRLNAGNHLDTPGLPLFEVGTVLPAVRSVGATAVAGLSLDDGVVPVTGEAPLVETWTLPEGHTWVSIDADGVLRSHPSEPGVQFLDHDGTGEATRRMLDALATKPSERHAYRLRLQPWGHYEELTDPFSGVH